MLVDRVNVPEFTGQTGVEAAAGMAVFFSAGLLIGDPFAGLLKEARCVRICLEGFRRANNPRVKKSLKLVKVQ